MTTMKLNEIAVAGSLYGAVGQAVRWYGVERTEVYLETPSPQLAHGLPGGLHGCSAGPGQRSVRGAGRPGGLGRHRGPAPGVLGMVGA